MERRRWRLELLDRRNDSVSTFGCMCGRLSLTAAELRNLPAGCGRSLGFLRPV
jgi:hypothetical protein